MTRCYNCRRNDFQKEIETADSKGHFAKGRAWRKYLNQIEEKILTTRQLKNCHPCSKECRDILEQMRKDHRIVRKDILFEKQKFLENAQKQYEVCYRGWVEARMLYGSDDIRTKKLQQKMQHYKRLAAQRQRRINEVKGVI